LNLSEKIYAQLNCSSGDSSEEHEIDMISDAINNNFPTTQRTDCSGIIAKELKI